MIPLHGTLVRRAALRSALIAFLICGAGATAAPDTFQCPAFPPPTGVAAVVQTTVSGGLQVRLSWTPPDQFAYQGAEFRRFRLERRDDTAAGTFGAPWKFGYYGGFFEDAYQDYFYVFVSDPDAFPTCDSHGECAAPGRTYTYRIISEYVYSSACDQYVAGQVVDSAPSAEVQVAIPGPPPPQADPPQNLVAVAEVKKARVHLAWDPPAAGPPERYEIRRRIVDASPSKAGPKETVFAKIYEVGSDVTSLVDKDVVPDETYEYVVASVVAAQATTSNADQAHTQPGKCPASAFDIWTGTWSGSGGAISYGGGFEATDGGKIFAAGLYDKQRSATSEDYTSLVLGAFAPPLVERKRVWKAAAKVVGVETSHGPVPPWAAALKQGARGRLRITMMPLDRFDADAWRRAEFLPTFGGRGVSIDMRLNVHEDDDAETPILFPTTLCATVAAGVANADADHPRPGKYRPVRPGENVVFVCQVTALGPSPLWSRRAAVQATLENGVILQTTEDGAEAVGTPAGLTTGRFTLGAIGPDGAGRSERATIVVVATVQDGGPGGQLRCTFSFVDGGEGLSNADTQPLEFQQRRPVELMIDRDPPAKR
jgi:hypothetical protein